MSAYAADLAGIHDAGFGHIATHGAALLIDTLARAGKAYGLVVGKHFSANPVLALLSLLLWGWL